MFNDLMDEGVIVASRAAMMKTWATRNEAAVAKHAAAVSRTLTGVIQNCMLR